MNYLIDTNVISEVRKGDRCNPNVSVWYASISDEDIFLSTLVLGEIRKGVELARARDVQKARALERWLEKVEVAFEGRILGIDNAVSDRWGRMGAIRPIPVIDGLLAATAVVNGLTLVTRNDRDIAGLGVKMLNPFQILDKSGQGMSVAKNPRSQSPVRMRSTSSPTVGTKPLA